MSAPGRGAAILVALSAIGCGMPGSELLLPPRPLRRADAIVVLGNRPPADAEGRITPELARRMRRGVELFERGLAPRLVVTGGASRGVVEADVMARYAEAHGVPASAILRERRASDTAENAGLSVRALCEGRPECAPRVIVVTSPHHLRRAVTLFRCAGARVQYAASDPPEDRGAQIAAAAYEYGAHLAYIVDDACARATITAARR
jgi:uncharacterized SAM-binding protein YcdF (DUF218 family)